jgi:putative tryptophan/tyrosine transport system substrate-binding protein
MELVAAPLSADADIERIIEGFAALPNGGLLFLPDATTLSRRELVVALAARYRLPAVYPLRPFVDAGGLMSYSTDVTEAARLSATYVDRILRGANPCRLFLVGKLGQERDWSLSHRRLEQSRCRLSR